MLLGAVTVAWLLSRGDLRDPADPALPVATGEARPEPSPTLPVTVTVPPLCEDAAALTPDEDQELHLADVEGRGCAVPVLWDGRILTVPATDGTLRRYELDARSGDRLLFGDWSCDGRFSPALYRPSTGHAFLFEGFAAAGQEITVDGLQTGVVDGEPLVVVEDGCHRLEIQPPE